MTFLTNKAGLKNRTYIFPATLLLALSLFLFIPNAAQAHVKWFSEFSFIDEPRTFFELLTPVYLSMIVLSVIVIGGMVYFERKLISTNGYGRLNKWLADRQRTTAC